MIDRKQAAELLSASTSRNKALLEAIYTAADDSTKAVLVTHVDLRQKNASVIEARIRLNQEEEDFRKAVRTIREALDPSLSERVGPYAMNGDAAEDQMKR